MDPIFETDGVTPYAPNRFKNIVKERYFISKKCNTSYLDVGCITPRERQIILDLIVEEAEKEKKMIEDAKKQTGGI